MKRGKAVNIVPDNSSETAKNIGENDPACENFILRPGCTDRERVCGNCAYIRPEPPKICSYELSRKFGTL